MYRQFGKRSFDLVTALLLLILLSPVMLITALIVRLRLGSPVLFIQERAGKDGQIFRVAKFRSMTDVRDDNGDLLPDSDRLTSTGQFIRAASLDELPQLWNVLRGEMSLVGPRPLLVNYLPLYNSQQARRHEVRPGITGWAQVNGRNAIEWEPRFEMDVHYVDQHGAWMDFKILLKTVQKVFSRSGVSANDHVTMEPFRGSPDSKQEKEVES